jgi:hypothetical protein
MRPTFLAVVLFLPSLGFAQGALTPLGAPAPTMKSLDQIEARTPLQAGAPGVSPDQNGGFIIERSGSYYLTGPLEVGSGNAISIYAPNVTLDLNGFTLSSTADDAVVRGTAIYAPNSADHLIIRNGHISGEIISQNNGTFTGRGFENGIDAPSVSAVNQAAANTLVEHVTVEGVMKNGISLERPTSSIRACSVYQCGQFGLSATDIADSNAAMCGSIALIAKGTASNCSASGQRGGISAVTAINCHGRSGTDTGLAATVATNCTGESYSGVGLQARECATGCSGTTTTGSYGIRVATLDSTPVAGTAENCRGSATGGGTGLSAETASNCFGQSNSGIGLSAGTASNSFASTASGTIAMEITGAATNCRGNCPAFRGSAIRASIAVSCTAAAGSIIATNKYNMP